MGPAALTEAPSELESPLFSREGWTDSDGVVWRYQSLAQERAAKRPRQARVKPPAPQRVPRRGVPLIGAEPCVVCGGPSEFGVAGLRYCSKDCP